MGERQHAIAESEKLPRPVGPYSPGVIYEGLLFVSGQGATDPATGRLAGLDVETQTEQVLRNIIRQMMTPDRLRGRMTSVNMIFFMGGPQLGELEAGLVANLFGAPISVVSGGLGCLGVTALLEATTPALRHYRRE